MIPYGLPQLLWVGLGGFLGSVGRFVISGFFNRLSPALAFPIGTLAVNILGCFLIGLLHGWAESRNILGTDTRIFLFIGVLGGFTTYSTFGFESLALLKDGAMLKASANIIIHVFVGLAAVWLGDTLGRL
ncbi:fluoride efflux transporter CrcB [Candidatus Nitrospira allomarina]|jgi:fluoride exporter|uniref:Fluoride-specific ion channel FluC n=1 Tax=Candidatus Nitrospira allomarina TaxID=3020900 RepID=A0AA96GG99_9BACT|nr:fluoride efflux transporter CrcB [Candidatus Nitrospira allomarina]WNM58338.1 fluoride efflux transporter CrcB [Candidatus Nitrospira allomarina]